MGGGAVACGRSVGRRIWRARGSGGRAALDVRGPWAVAGRRDVVGQSCAVGREDALPGGVDAGDHARGPRVLHERAAVDLVRPVGREGRLGVGDALGLVARAAALVGHLEGDRGIGHVRRALEGGEAVPGERRQLVPDEVELKAERGGRLPLHRGVGEHVVVRVRVPPSADRPLGDAAPGAAAALLDGGVHPRLLIEVADDPGGLEVGQALAEEEVEGRLIVGRERGLRLAEGLTGRSRGAAREEGKGQRSQRPSVAHPLKEYRKRGPRGSPRTSPAPRPPRTPSPSPTPWPGRGSLPPWR